MVERKPVFATFFPGCENIHLTKDIGMIPFVLQRDFNYESYLICYKNGDYPYLTEEVPGLKLIFINKGPWHLFTTSLKKILKQGLIVRFAEAFSVALDALPTLLRYSKKINVLQMYHLKDESILIGWIYRIFNRKGLLYLKLDINSEIIAKYEQAGKDSQRSVWVYNSLRFDLISAESKKAVKVLNYTHLYFQHRNLCYIPNGADIKKLAGCRTGAQKESLILHVGRIGSPQKRTDLVLEAFAGVAREFPGWKLALVGPVEEQFANIFQGFLKENEDLKDRVVTTGFLKDRRQVFEYYERASVLLMPSKFEGFSLASVEALYFGDVIIGSDIPAIRELTRDEEIGLVCPVGSLDCLQKKLKSLILDEKRLGVMSAAATKHAIDNYDWVSICSKLNEHLNALRKISE